MTECTRSQVNEEPKNPKRKTERHSCRLKMRCRQLKAVGFYASDDRYFEGFVKNRSEGGFMLESPIYFALGARLEVAFHSPDDRKSYLGIVTVRWVRKMNNGYFYLGVATDKMDVF